MTARRPAAARRPATIRRPAAARRPATPQYALLLLLAVALAACGNLPQPFQPAAKSTRVWVGAGPANWGSILVRPIEGLPAPLSAALAGKVVEALHARAILASAHAASRGSIALEGKLSVVSGRLRWALVAPGGEILHRFDAPRPGGASRRRSTVPDLDAAAARAARQIAAALDEHGHDSGGASTRADVVLDAVRGAPGDGGTALAHAMRDSLARSGFSVAHSPDEAALLVEGRVSVAPSDITAGGATVAIAWTVLRPDGTRIGTVTQSNHVSAARLAGPWGLLAETVASAGAPGIAQLLRLAPQHEAVRAAARAPSPTVEAPIAPSLTAEAPLAPSPTVEAPIAPWVSAEAPIARPPTVESPIAPSVLAEAPLAPPASVEAPIAVWGRVR